MSSPTVDITDVPTCPSIKVVTIRGDMDELGLNELLDAIKEKAVDPHVRCFVLDLQLITFMNSKGLGYLVVLHSSMEEKGQQLCLAGKNEFITDLISMVGVENMIPYFPSVPEAIDTMKKQITELAS